MWQWKGAEWAVAWTDKWGIPKERTLQAGGLLVQALESGQGDVVGVIGRLRKLSGQGYGSDPRVWRAWLERLRKGK